MKKIITLLFCVATSLASMGQEMAPHWTTAKGREFYFPADSYFTGFAMGNVRSNENIASAIARLKKDAQAYLSESIRVKVESESNSYTRNLQVGENTEFGALFTNAIKTVSNAEIAGVKLESYVDKSNNTVYAFACAGRADLATYYKNQVSLYLNKIESALNTAAELASKGAKVKARKQCEEVIKHFATVAYAQDLLTAVDVQADDAALQQSRSERLRNELVQTLTDLENSIYVYIMCKEVVDGEEVEYIADKLPGLLTDNDCGCNFTTDEANADYVVKVDAYIARCNDSGGGTVYCWANATVSLYNAHTQKTLKPKITEAKGGWTGKNYTKAGEEAFDELAKKIVEKVIPMMKN